MRETSFMHEVTIASGKQGRTGRRADSRRMKVRISETIISQAVKRWRTDHAPECAGRTIPHIIQDDPEDIGSPGRSLNGIGPPFFRIGQGLADDSLIGGWWCFLGPEVACNQANAG